MWCSIGINLTKSSSPSVGARVVEWGREGFYGRPRPVPCAHLWENALTPPPPGDHKGPPHIRPTALAPTDHPASCLASRLRLMSITADLSAPRAPSTIQGTNVQSIIGQTEGQGYQDEFVKTHLIIALPGQKGKTKKIRRKRATVAPYLAGRRK